MKDNMYIQSLKMGYEKGNEGVSLNEVVKELGINFPDDASKVNYIQWFYSNFYQSDMEVRVSNSSIHLRLTPNNLKEVLKYNNIKSYIKGEALNKYIDYLELEKTKKSSRTATTLSIVSIIIASLAVILPALLPKYFTPSYEIIIPDKRNETTTSEPKDSSNSKVNMDKMSNTKRDSTSKLNAKN